MVYNRLAGSLAAWQADNHGNGGLTYMTPLSPQNRKNTAHESGTHTL